MKNAICLGLCLVSLSPVARSSEAYGYTRVVIDEGDNRRTFDVDQVTVDVRDRSVYFGDVGVLLDDCSEGYQCFDSGSFAFSVPQACEGLEALGSWQDKRRSYSVVGTVGSTQEDGVLVIEGKLRDGRQWPFSISHYSPERGLLFQIVLGEGKEPAEYFVSNRPIGVLRCKE